MSSNEDERSAGLTPKLVLRYESSTSDVSNQKSTPNLVIQEANDNPSPSLSKSPVNLFAFIPCHFCFMELVKNKIISKLLFRVQVWRHRSHQHQVDKLHLIKIEREKKMI